MRASVQRLRLGPIVGHTDHESSRVWIRVRDDPSLYRLRVQGHGTFDFVSTEVAYEFGTAIAVAGGLQSDRRYRYRVLRRGRVVPGGKGSFRTMPHPTSMAEVLFAAISCSANLEEGAWPRLASFVDDAEPRFLLLMGDQVYLDQDEPNVWSQFLEGDPAERRAAMAEKYQLNWSRPAVHQVLANVPTYMMWDDHEIRDGWGSFAGDSPTLAELHPRGAEITTSYRAFFEDARDVYWHFQMCRNLLPDYVDPASPPGHRRAIPVAFRCGRLQVVMLDGRGDRDVFRSEKPILGGEQWTFLDGFLADLDADVDALAVVTPVPIVSMSPEGQTQFLFGQRTDDVEVYRQGRMDELEKVRTEGDEDLGQLVLAGLAGDLRSRTGLEANWGSFKVADIDDVRDQWSHHFSRPEQEALIRKVSGARLVNRTEANARSLIFLGGDLHAGGIFDITLHDDPEVSLPCLISSGISKRPGSEQLLSSLFDATFEVAPGIDTRLRHAVGDFNYGAVHVLPTGHGAEVVPVLAHEGNSFAWGLEASLGPA